MRHLHIPRLDLDLVGVDPDTTREVINRLPEALAQALSAGGHTAGPLRPVPGSAEALADRAAHQVAARVRAGSHRRGS